MKQERLDKLRKLLERKINSHTNPVEVGISDFTWLIEQAEKQEATMCDDKISEQIDQLEALVARQRRLLEIIYDAWDAYLEAKERLNLTIQTARSASTMTGTDES